ncbi:MAG: ABC transporter ATP-binding protein [Candidatus Omnitrophica bacterium]|nr:ABC transporter ATP-binding protein [Candidatus Omnitrophota bacterium]
MKTYLKEYFRLLKFARSYVGFLVLAAVCMGISTIFEGVTFTSLAPIIDRIFTNKDIVIPGEVPLFLQNIVNRLNAVEPISFLKYILGFVVILFFLKGVFFYIQEYLMNVIGQGVVKLVRNDLYKKFQQLSMDFYGKKRTGELMSRVTNDVSVITNGISYALKDLIFESMKVIVFAVLALWLGFKISWILLIVVFVLFPAIMIPVAKLGKKIKKYSVEVQMKMADLNSHMAETIQGAHIVKAFCREDYEIERFAKINHQYYRFNLKAIRRIIAVSPITELIGVVGVVSIISLIAPQIISGRLSFGVFAAFIGFLVNMIRPMKKLSNVYAINQRALAASSRIYDILDETPQIKEAQGAVKIEGLKDNIRFENVWFAYNKEDGFVLQDINLEIKKGETIAFVGHSGVGKTTLAGLIPRFYDPQKGRVLIDGVDIKELNINSLRSLISIVSQDTILFNATIRDNIAYGRLDASESEIIEAAKKANAYEFIVNTPDKFNTVIGDRGFRLSGGEKQRLAIARAVLKNSPILILDEATSSLDSVTEKLIKEAFFTLMEGKTAFVIAHRLSTVQKADRIVVLKKGQIAEIGSHSDLISDDTLYKKLYSLQFNV